MNLLFDRTVFSVYTMRRVITILLHVSFYAYYVKHSLKLGNESRETDIKLTMHLTVHNTTTVNINKKTSRFGFYSAH